MTTVIRPIFLSNDNFQADIEVNTFTRGQSPVQFGDISTFQISSLQRDANNHVEAFKNGSVKVTETYVDPETNKEATTDFTYTLEDDGKGHLVLADSNPATLQLTNPKGGPTHLTWSLTLDGKAQNDTYGSGASTFAANFALSTLKPTVNGATGNVLNFVNNSRPNNTWAALNLSAVAFNDDFVRSQLSPAHAKAFDGKEQLSIQFNDVNGQLQRIALSWTNGDGKGNDLYQGEFGAAANGPVELLGTLKIGANEYKQYDLGALPVTTIDDSQPGQ